MYVPKHFEESNREVLHQLMIARPLGTWVTVQHGEPTANHIPFLLDPNRGEFGTLRAHVARANPVWKSLDRDVNSIVIFHGPDDYITPNWYEAKTETGKVVPTWNYSVVHANGVAQAIEDKTWLLEVVSQLTDVHESAEIRPWKVTDAPPDFISAMLDAIVGIEIPISRLEGKMKWSQNRSEHDRLAIRAGLNERAKL